METGHDPQDPQTGGLRDDARLRDLLDELREQTADQHARLAALLTDQVNGPERPEEYRNDAD